MEPMKPVVMVMSCEEASATLYTCIPENSSSERVEETTKELLSFSVMMLVFTCQVCFRKLLGSDFGKIGSCCLENFPAVCISFDAGDESLAGTKCVQ